MNNEAYQGNGENNTEKRSVSVVLGYLAPNFSTFHFPLLVSCVLKHHLALKLDTGLYDFGMQLYNFEEKLPHFY